jgi:hypothetical protein
MELREFVRETIVQIISGVLEAQGSDIVVNSSAAVVPAGQGTADTAAFNREVVFDVVVSAREGTATKGGIGIFVGPLAVGSHGQSHESSDLVNRVKFTVPIYLPAQRIRR